VRVEGAEMREAGERGRSRIMEEIASLQDASRSPFGLATTEGVWRRLRNTARGSTNSVQALGEA
jgi:hypothetical protein